MTIVNITRANKEVSIEGRLVYLENLANHALKNKFPQRELHGEIQLLYGGYIGHLAEGFRLANKGEHKAKPKPVLLMYSYYIPCASKKSCDNKHSCAQELHRYMESGMREVSEMVISYSEVFVKSKGSNSPVEDTDLNHARQFMQGPLRCYKVLVGDQMGSIRLDYTPPTYYSKRKRTQDGIEGENTQQVSVKKGRYTFNTQTVQRYLFDCVSKMPLATCCTGFDKETQMRLVTLSVNHAVFSCMPRNDILLSQTYSRQQLHACLGNWVEEHVGGNCPLCSNGNVGQINAIKFMYRPCILTASYSGTVIGRPTIWGGFTDPRWSPPDNNSPYLEDPRAFLASQILYCQPGQLDPIGFCSKTKEQSSDLSMTGHRRMQRYRPYGEQT